MKKGDDNLYGLILTGGKSTRLGKDKYQIEYHAMPQVQYLFDLITSAGLETFVSCSKVQEDNLKSSYPLIVDKLKDIGPMGALSAAFEVKPNAAWLVVACDLPFVNQKTIRTLVAARSRDHLMTTYQGVESKFFETTISIYEPAVSAVMKNAYATEQYSLRRAMDPSKIKIIKSTNTYELFNANTQDAVDFSMAQIKQY